MANDQGRSLKVDIEELRWLLKGYEVRTISKLNQFKKKLLLESLKNLKPLEIKGFVV